MSARYLVRIDDLCPTAAWESWDRVEAALRRHDVRPLVAVVPDNKDPGLVAGPVDDRFWDRVRQWQSWGWAIGLHGYQHVYETEDAGLVGLRAKSEFAGLPVETQHAKLDAGLAVFAEQGVVADAWIAPGHTFDAVTVDALVQRGITVISDGFHTRAAKDANGVVWVPQQLWRFRQRRRGLWTVCYHVNRWTSADHVRFESDLEVFAPRIVGLAAAVSAGSIQDMTASDAVAARLVRAGIRARQLAASVVHH